jgi:leucyl-tRNA synthetase
LAEEFWNMLWNEFSIFSKWKWPEYDEKYLVAAEVTLAIQFNGKMRWTLQLPADATQDQVLQAIKENEKLWWYLQSEPKKVIFIPWKIMNIIL